MNYQLKTGDIVEVLTSANSFGPSRDWINLVYTTRAKNKIKRFFKLQDRDENIIKGRELLEKQITELGFNFKDFMTKQGMKDIAARFNFGTEEDLLASIGFGEISYQTVANKMTDKARKEIEDQKWSKLLLRKRRLKDRRRKAKR